MTEITLSAPAATGPPGPPPLTGTDPGGQSARAAASAGPLTTEASPFDRLLSLLTGTPPDYTTPEEGTVPADPTTDDEDPDEGASPSSPVALPAAAEDPCVPLALSCLAPASAPTPAFARVIEVVPAAAARAEPPALAAVSSGLSAAGIETVSPASGLDAAIPAASVVMPSDDPAAAPPARPVSTLRVHAMAAGAAGAAGAVPVPASPAVPGTDGPPAPGQDPLPDVTTAVAPPPVHVNGPEEAVPPVVAEARTAAAVAAVGLSEPGAEAATEEKPLLPEASPSAPARDTAPTEPQPAGAAALPASIAAEPPDPADRAAEPLRAHLREMPATPGRHEVTLILTPESLGELRVRLTTGPGGEVRAAITATTPEAQASLLGASEGLRSTLAERGLRLDGFIVTLDAPASASAGRSSIQQPDAAGQAAGSQMFLGGGGQQGQNGAFRPSYAAYRGHRDDPDAAQTAMAPVALVGAGRGPASAGHLNLLA